MPLGHGLFYELMYEFVARRVMNTWDNLRGQKVQGGQAPSSATTAAEKNISNMEIKEAVALLWSAPGLKDSSREHFIQAHRALSKKRKDKFEEGLGALLKQFKNGIWPHDLERITEKVPSSPQKGAKAPPPQQSRTFEKKVYQRGWNPANVYVKTLNKAGESVESVKVFIDWLLQDSVWDDAVEEFKEKIEKIIPVAKKVIFWTTMIYLFLLVLTGTAAWIFLGGFLNAPTKVSLLITGSLSLLAFLGLLWIVFKPALPKGV